MNDTECDECGGASTLDMEDFLDYILDDMKSELRSQAQVQPWCTDQQQLEVDLERHCAALRTQLLDLRTA